MPDLPSQLGLALLSFGSLLAVVDPLAAIPMYVSATSGATRAEQIATLRRAVLTGLGVLVTFGLLGEIIFLIFGISTMAFRIAGGIILFQAGMDMLQAHRSRLKATEEEDAEASLKDDISIVPLGMPMIAGPGAITTVLAMLSRADSTPARATVYLTIVAVMIVTYLTLRVAPLVARRLGVTGMHVIERVMGLIVTVVGVQFVMDGLREAVVQVSQQIR